MRPARRARPRVAGRQREQERLGQQQLGVEPADRCRLDALVGLGDEDVELAGAQQGDAVLGLVLADGDDQLGIAAGKLERRGEHQPRGRARERADDHAAAHHLLLGRQLCLGGVELREHALGARHEPVGGRREPHPAAVALEQGDARLALELEQ